MLFYIGVFNTDSHSANFSARVKHNYNMSVWKWRNYRTLWLDRRVLMEVTWKTVLVWPKPCPITHLSYPFSAFLFVDSFSFCSFWSSSHAATSLKDGKEWKTLSIHYDKSIRVAPFTQAVQTNSHIDVTAKVLEELDFALAEQEAWFEGHRARQGSVETSQDLGLVLCHVSTVLQLKQVQIEFRTCL